jgi:hypothetical protein
VSGPVFMFCAPELIFDGAECVGSRFLVLRCRTHFRRYRVCWVPFSCFALPNSFSAVTGASGSIFMFCTPKLVFGCTEGDESRFHVLRSRTLFLRFRACRVPFSFFALLDSFSAVLRASGPVFRFCAPGFVFGDTEGVPSRFQVFFSRTCFRRYRCRRVPFSYFARPDSFSAVPGC